MVEKLFFNIKNCNNYASIDLITFNVWEENVSGINYTFYIINSNTLLKITPFHDDSFLITKTSSIVSFLLGLRQLFIQIPFEKHYFQQKS